MDPIVSPIDVHQLCGNDTLKRAASVDQTKLLMYMGKGYMKRSELDKFRKIVDVKDRYILTLAEREERRHQHFRIIQQMISLYSQN